MLTTDQVFSDLKKIMATLLKKSLEEVEQMARYDSLLKDDLGIDSVESLDFLHALESFYSTAISDEEAARLEKVSDVIDLIISKK